MPATSLRAASERQRAFIRSLMAERTDESLAPLADELQTFVVSGTIRSDLIDRLIAIPRQAPTGSVVREGGGDEVPSPVATVRAGRMLLAGGIEATATLDSGEHVTVRIRTRKRSGRGWANAALGEQDSRTTVSILGSKVGWLNVDESGRLLLTLRTRRLEFRVAVEAVLHYAAGRSTGTTRVQEASRCGRCFLTLTDPVSIDRGIGPDCFGRDTGSQHVARERAFAAAHDEARLDVEAQRRIERDREEIARWEQHDADFAAREREQETAAVQDEALAAVAADLPRTGSLADRPAGETARARDLIAEALDAYFGEPETSFALAIFDQLAAR